MTKLCPRGKAAAKRKFKVYPSAYANAYASKICAGKIKDPSGVKRKDFRGSKAEGGPMDNKREMGREQSTIPSPRFVMGTRPYQGGSTNFIKKIPFSENFKESIQKLKEENPGFRVRRLTEDDLFKMRRRMGKRKPRAGKIAPIQRGQPPKKIKTRPVSRSSRMGGGLMEATARLKRQGLRGGGICTKGMNRDAVGKNS